MVAFSDPVPSILITESLERANVLLFELLQFEASESRANNCTSFVMGFQSSQPEPSLRV